VGVSNALAIGAVLGRKFDFEFFFYNVRCALAKTFDIDWFWLRLRD
jgi:hypothetical protein